MEKVGEDLHVKILNKSTVYEETVVSVADGRGFGLSVEVKVDEED